MVWTNDRGIHVTHLFLPRFAIFPFILPSGPVSFILKKARAQGYRMACTQMRTHQLQHLINITWLLRQPELLNGTVRCLHNLIRNDKGDSKRPKVWQQLGPQVWLEQDGGTEPATCSRQLKEISASICQLITEYHSNLIQPEPAPWSSQGSDWEQSFFPSSHYPVNIRSTFYNVSWHPLGYDGACLFKIVFYHKHVHIFSFAWCFDLNFSVPCFFLHLAWYQGAGEPHFKSCFHHFFVG